jgi:hypothetical protein
MIDSNPYMTTPVISFFPSAPTVGGVAPVAPRHTPYAVPPTECFLNLNTGAVACRSTESYGGLPSSDMFYSGLPYGMGTGLNSVHGMPLDSPLNRILQREPVGPWQVVGYVTTDTPAMAQSRDRTMALHAQTVDTRRDRYNYRAVDSNGVPLDLGEKVNWIMDGSPVAIPGQSATYTAHLYKNFR